MANCLSTLLSYSEVVIQTHEIKQGQTLFIISQLYNVSVDSLQKVNAIYNKNLVRVGQMIFIPKPGCEPEKMWPFSGTIIPSPTP